MKKNLMPGHKKNSQAMTYLKETKILKNFKNSNSCSTGMIKPYKEVIYENSGSKDGSKASLYSFKNDSPSIKTKNAANWKKISCHKAGRSLKFNYLKKNKKMNALSSSVNLRKHLSSSKSFSSLHGCSLMKYSGSISNLKVTKDSILHSPNYTEKLNSDDRSKYFDKLGKEKGIRKWQIKLINNSSGSEKFTSNPVSSSSALRESKSRTSRGMQKYKSQSHLHNTPTWQSCVEAKKSLDQIILLESKLNEAESKLKLQRKHYENRELELNQHFQAEIKEKDEEIATSKTQISQLLRIIEQITQNTHSNSKGKLRMEGEKSPFL